MLRTLLVGVLLSACATPPQAKDHEMSNRETVRKLYEDCINIGNLPLLPSLVSNEYLGPNGERGPAGFEQTVSGLRHAFPDIRFTIEDLLPHGDKVAVRWTWKGTHKGAFRGLGATDKPITTTGTVIYELRDGKIIRSWLDTDRLGVLQQMGLIPKDVTKLSR